MHEQQNLAAASSLAEVLGQRNGALTPMPPEALHLWLPELQTPAGWVDTTTVATAPVARMLLRRPREAGPWDACELINLYQVPGRISPDMVVENADLALRDGGASDIHVYLRDDVPTAFDGLMAVRVSARLAVGGREVEAVYNYYAINTCGDAGLIEQAIVIGADAAAALAVEVDCLAESVYQSLLASLHSAAPTTQPRELPTTGSPLSVVTQAGHLTTSTTASPGTVTDRTVPGRDGERSTSGNIVGAEDAPYRALNVGRPS